jgi:hypothetical protein
MNKIKIKTKIPGVFTKWEVSLRREFTAQKTLISAFEIRFCYNLVTKS